MGVGDELDTQDVLRHIKTKERKGEQKTHIPPPSLSHPLQDF